MLEEAVRHFLQRQPHVLEADFLADDVERRMREAIVHGAHHPGEHRAVADAGIEHAKRRRPWMQMRELLGDAVRHLPLLAAGIDEQQILLPVVEEAEIALWIGGRAARRRLRRWHVDAGRLERRSGSWSRFARSFNHDWTWPLWRMSSHESMDAIERIGSDAAAIAQPCGELAVVDGTASEGRLRQPRRPAIVGDFLQ
jgi:hypothetical protein